MSKLHNFRNSESGQKWLAKRQALPVFEIEAGIKQALQDHDACVVAGDTGCGKTTQVSSAASVISVPQTEPCPFL